MKKTIITLAVMTGLMVTGFNKREEVKKQIKIASVKMELKALNSTSKDMELANKTGARIPESKWEKLKADKTKLIKELKELQAL